MAVKESSKQVDGGPHGFPVDDLRRRRDDDAEEGYDRETKRNADDLRPYSVARAVRPTGEVRGVGDQGRHVADATHDCNDHLPSEGRARERAGLVDNGSNTVGFYDAPDEEDDAGNRGKDGFGGEEMATVR